MPTVAIWSPADFGTTSYVFSGTYTMSGTPDVAEFSDDDAFFHDGPADSGVPPETGDDQLLTTDLVVDGNTVGTVGDPIYNAAEAVIVNNTTGEVGRILYITVGDGGTGAGFVGYASTIFIAPGDSFTISNVDVSSSEVIEPYANIIPCFTRGTPILTDKGERPIESLTAGDLVMTKGSGLQPIRWIGSRTVPALGKFAPVVISAGAMGNDVDLVVSPQHRLLVADWKIEMTFDVPEALVAAKNLLHTDGVFLRPGGEVEYFHMMFDQHQIVFGAGIPSESFYPGAQAVDGLDHEQRKEVLALFPELAGPSPQYPHVEYTTLKAHEAAALNG